MDHDEVIPFPSPMRRADDPPPRFPGPPVDDGAEGADSPLRARARETIALIEILDRDGQVRQLMRVPAWPVRIGRAIDCDIVIDDPHVAAHHATLVERDGQVWLVPRRTVNPVRLGRRRLPPEGAVALDGRTVVTIGTTLMRLRFAGETLEPEEPLRGPQHAQGWRQLGLAGLVAVAALWVGFEGWVESLPGTPWVSIASMALVAPLALAAWCGTWALGSKLFTRHFAFWPHLEVALFWSLLGMASLSLGNVLAFSLSMPSLASVGHAGALGAGALMVWRHLVLVLPQKRRSAAWALVAVVGLALALDVAERRFKEQPLAGDLYLTELQPPALRIAPTRSVDEFVQSARPLEKQLGRLARDRGEDASDEEDEGEE